ncbi:trypsin-like peptidase domain-containing protein [Nostoc sp. FACHB-87]|uniref:trypsin-like serine peptidase n=1 Tax=Nostocaceae TaxID=1162 RepID=UPI0016837A10|nr:MULTISPECIES: trypsin-like serine protease [Nostocaceae]MBD2453942.1 trypsin-like peptidase domain-containing protein [Nostoc sp. FACHB-87]MBD2476067.1 trypsin-like peptidase domain-containing protein [Anabaena sp. FACHB-83]
MNNKSILFISGVVGLMTLGVWFSVEAQVKKQPVTTTAPTLKKVGQLELQNNGKPFKPSELEQSNKPIKKGTRGTIGRDDRLPMLSNNYPWSTVGRIVGESNSQTYTCTGTLIDEDIVLTNAHCVVDPKTGNVADRVAFLPNVVDGRYQDRAYAVQYLAGTHFQDQNAAANDWAVIKIDRPLGRKYGYLGWKSLPSTTLIRNEKKFFFVGYSGDYPQAETEKFWGLTAGQGWTAGFQAGCSIVDEQSSILLHDCDTAGGSSGGPIIASIGGEPYIVALNNAEIKDSSTGKGIINLAVNISFLDRLFGKK